MRRDYSLRYNFYIVVLFQSTRLHEAWLTCYIAAKSQPRFQSTRLHEAWRWPCQSLISIKLSFNPHACMRRDVHYKYNSVLYGVFQSTRLHEAWRWRYCNATYTCKFQSTRLHEAWRKLLDISRGCTSFNPHACMRRDRQWGWLSVNDISFNPHACMRRDRMLKERMSMLGIVSIHTPAWGVTW